MLFLPDKYFHITANSRLQCKAEKSTLLQADIYLLFTSGGTIRRELDFQTRVRVLASISIPIGNVGNGKKKQRNPEDVLSGR